MDFWGAFYGISDSEDLNFTNICNIHFGPFSIFNTDPKAGEDICYFKMVESIFGCGTILMGSTNGAEV